MRGGWEEWNGMRRESKQWGMSFGENERLDADLSGWEMALGGERIRNISAVSDPIVSIHSEQSN